MNHLLTTIVMGISQIEKEIKNHYESIQRAEDMIKGAVDYHKKQIVELQKQKQLLCQHPTIYGTRNKKYSCGKCGIEITDISTYKLSQINMARD